MKRLLALLIALIITLSSLTSCDVLRDLGIDLNFDLPIGPTETPDNEPNDPETPEGPENPEGPNTPDGPENPEGSNTPEKPDAPTPYLYNDFSPSEKAIFNRYIGAIIPFVSNNEYYVEGYYDIDDYENGINFYTIGNTEADFEVYRNIYINGGYELVETYQDSYGDTWYCYQKDDLVVELGYYVSYDADSYIDVYVYSSLSEDPDDGSGDGNTGDNTGDNTGKTYTDFTSEEKALFNEYFGFVIPFIANDEYYVEEYTYEDEKGINFYAFGNTTAEFTAYKALYSSYTYLETYEDEYGDPWYCYEKNGVVVEFSHYYYEGEYVLDLYVYVTDDSSGDGNTGDNTGDNDAYGDTDIIINDGKGLPTDGDGVYDVDLTLGDPVKNVTEQGYYIDGCPTVGSPAVLVIPVQFSDIMASSKGYTIDAIKNAFEKDGETDYYSVYDYYEISSYGQLTLDITVLDFWFEPQYKSTYYESYYEDGYLMGDQLIMDEALKYLAGIMDLSQFDSDNNGIIDAVVLVNTLDVGDDDFHWAYRYWNYYVDDDGYYYEYDGVSANDYLWASYQFLHESYDENGNVTYDNESGMDTYTYIHEFGHVLGADDYYDTAYESDPMSGCDIMDSMKGDHNAYTKFNLGWLTSTRLVVTDSSVTLTLEDFSRNGDTVIIANNWDDALGAYQEYYIVAYYTNNGLNSGDNGYFLRDGIVVYHVNASLYSEEFEGEIYYDVYNNNTDSSDSNGTVNNLIEYVTHDDGTFTYVVGDSLPTQTLDGGETLGYTFTVDSLTSDEATIIFTKI